jgi:negative elongation factor A
LGNIVTIKLSEDQETVSQADDTVVTTTVETHFQMNYNTGEWKRIKKVRKIEDLTAVAASTTPVSTPLPATSATAT